ncbi:MAG: cytochrome c [Deltaproteobacteria bacterium]|nr:cytochrome c [Deltaproteobacteria bacterium]
MPALIVLGFIVWFANWIPQTRWEPPKTRQITAAMSPSQLAGLGKAIVRERGCLACHTIEPGVGVKGHGRGPNLANIAARRVQGVPGGPGNLVEYLAQALYEPGAYLVEGYAGIMPSSVRAPAKLNYEEVTAAVAYLQSLGGKPTARVGDLPRPPAEAETARTTQGEGTAGATDPKDILTKFDCLTCHSLKPGEVLVGPPFETTLLKKAAAARGVTPEAYIMESIIDPRAVEVGDFPKETMPDDYGKRLTAAQIYALTRYLIEPEKKK